MRGLLFAAAIAVLGTGVIANTPLGTPLVEPLREWAESLETEHGGPYRGEHVDDGADVLGPLAEAVEGVAAGYWTDLGIDVRVVTVRAAGADLAELALRELERTPERRATTGGLLVLIDAAGRRARIETAYDLEGALPDAVLARVARDQLAPYAGYGAVGMAVMDSLHMLKDYALEQAARGNLPLAEELKERAIVRERAREIAGGGGAWARLPELPSDGDAREPVPAARRRRYAPSRDPYQTIEALRRVWRDGVGDPTLELFTPESRIQRASYPSAPYEQWQRLRALEASLPLRLRQDGDRAVAWSERPARGFVPVLLRRADGRWEVDLAETWKSLFFDAQGNYILYNTSSPYAFGLGHLRQGHPRGLLPVVLEEPVEDAVARLEARDDAAAKLELAEILMRNCFAVVRSLALYEEASALAPDDLEIARLYGERALYLGLHELAIRELRRAGPAAWHRVAHVHALAGNRDQAERYYRRALRRNPESAVAREGLERLIGAR